MTSVAKDRLASRARAERVAIDALVERLAGQFPELAAEDIVRAVNGQHSTFEGCKVRDFVPILVERAARHDLGDVPRHRA